MAGLLIAVGIAFSIAFIIKGCEPIIRNANNKMQIMGIAVSISCSLVWAINILFAITSISSGTAWIITWMSIGGSDNEPYSQELSTGHLFQMLSDNRWAYTIEALLCFVTAITMTYILIKTTKRQTENG
jgi:hypothetical protein